MRFDVHVHVGLYILNRRRLYIYTHPRYLLYMYRKCVSLHVVDDVLCFVHMGKEMFWIIYDCLWYGAYRRPYRSSSMSSIPQHKGKLCVCDDANAAHNMHIIY